MPQPSVPSRRGTAPLRVAAPAHACAAGAAPPFLTAAGSYRGVVPPDTSALLGGLRLLLSLADVDGTTPAGGPLTEPAPAHAPSSWSQRSPQETERIAALVGLAQRGDAEAFGMLYAEYVQVVYRYVYVRVGSVALAEDLTSETFLRAMRSIGSFAWQGRDIAAWFVTIARNLIVDNAKSARFRMEVTTADLLDADPGVEGPETQTLEHLRDVRLLEAVRGLRPEQAECVVLRFFTGLSLADTAVAMGRSEGAVKQLQLRAVRALQRCLEGEAL